MADYREKIRRLLALAESPNENEAKAALLKARELMARHKLTEKDVRDAEPQKVTRMLTDITCSKRRDPWCVSLSAIIGENYCCKAFHNHSKGSQTQTVGFIGFEDDVALCAEIFKYAVDCVRSEVKRIKRKYADQTGDYIKCRCDSFGYGFNAGLKAAFTAQTEEHQQWGLVLVTPKEVQDAADKIGKPTQFRSRSQNSLFGNEFAHGYKQGQEFDPQRRLAGAREAAV